VVEQSNWASINWQGQDIKIEYQWVGANNSKAPPIVFLHEGLGSCAMWKTFPDRLCQAVNLRGLLYSRPGYGKSTPRASEKKLPYGFLHDQAYEVLPALLRTLKITEPYIVFGHSDGASIALLHASDPMVLGVIAMAPHLFVEDITIKSIAEAKTLYEVSNLKEKLSRYHDDVDSAFWGWNDVWLTQEFKTWSIKDEVRKINVPLLAIQGENDQYGTLDQINFIPQLVAGAKAVAIPDCKHSPHFDQPDLTIEFSKNFIHKILHQGE
jgi:pimeloyl-ACP methyl ester carboxylesterase